MNDNEILGLFLDRSETAISEIEKKYGKMLFYISFQILRNEQDSEECVNDTYLAMWQTIPPNCPENLKVYSGRVVRNISINRWRKNSAQKRCADTMLLLSELDDCIPNSIDEIQNEIAYRELVHLLNEYVSDLNDTKQVLFVRRYWYAEPVPVIAKRYGVSENYISLTLFRVRKGLKKFLEKKGFYL